MLLSVVILLKVCQLWLFIWMVLLLLLILRVVITIILLSSIVVLPLTDFIIYTLVLYCTIMITLVILLSEYGDTRAGDKNSIFLSKFYPNSTLLQRNNFTGLIRQVPLDFIQNKSPGCVLLQPITHIVHCGLYKAGEPLIRNHCYIFPCDIFSQWLSRFRILYIPKFHLVITYWIDLVFVVHILDTLPNLCIYLISIVRWI